MRKKVLMSFILTMILVSSTLSYAISEDRTDDGLYVENEVLMCSCGIPIIEHNKNIKEGIEPRAAICDCGGRLFTKLGSSTPWATTGNSKKCSHKLNGHDYEYSRLTPVHYSCGSCGFKYNTVRTDTMWECRGF